MSSIMLFASNTPFPEVLFPANFTVHIDVDRGVIDDGGSDDIFAIYQHHCENNRKPSYGWLAVVLSIIAQKSQFSILKHIGWQETC